MRVWMWLVVFRRAEVDKPLSLPPPICRRWLKFDCSNPLLASSFPTLVLSHSHTLPLDLPNHITRCSEAETRHESTISQLAERTEQLRQAQAAAAAAASGRSSVAAGVAGGIGDGEEGPEAAASGVLRDEDELQLLLRQEVQSYLVGAWGVMV